jgi:hypothetical protein
MKQKERKTKKEGREVKERGGRYERQQNFSNKECAGRQP